MIMRIEIATKIKIDSLDLMTKWDYFRMDSVSRLSVLVI